MANLEKHVKPLVAQLADAESSLVPTRARGSHLVDRYIKVPRRRRSVASHPKKASSPVLLRLDASTPDVQQRIRKRALELNAELKQAKLPFRLRIV
jgi:hypothetical protein